MKRRPRMIFKLLLFLLAGAIINVAVAWGAPLRWWDYDVEGGNLASDDRDWKWLDNQGWPLAGNYTWHYMRQGLGWREDQFALKRPIDSDPTISAPLTAYRDRAGWPLYALGYYSESGRGEFAQFDKWHGGMHIDGRLIGQRRDHGIFVYTSPIWPGFAINTIFYAAVLWVLFAVPGRVRRWRRIKRGQCAACGYSLVGSTSEKCPECGVPTRQPDEVSHGSSR